MLCAVDGRSSIQGPSIETGYSYLTLNSRSMEMENGKYFVGHCNQSIDAIADYGRTCGRNPPPSSARHSELKLTRAGDTEPSPEFTLEASRKVLLRTPAYWRKIAYGIRKDVATTRCVPRRPVWIHFGPGSSCACQGAGAFPKFYWGRLPPTAVAVGPVGPGSPSCMRRNP